MKKTKNKFGGTLGAVIAAVCIVIYLAALVQGAVRVYMSIDMQSAAAGIFDYAELTKILKETLFIVLIGFTIAFFTMLLQLLLAKPDGGSVSSVVDDTDGGYAVKEKTKGYSAKHSEDSPEDRADFEYGHETFKMPFNEPVAETFKMPFNEPIDESFKMPFNEPNVEPFNPVDDFESGDFSDDSASSDAYGIVDDDSEISDADDSTPKGLYSPRSNIGWEEYTKDRLNSELHRCASTEKDLTLLNIEFTDTLNDIQFKQAAEEAVSFFSSRDLLFERGRRGITVIAPGIDLETGLSKAQVFQKRIWEKLFFNHNVEDCVYIGLTSRAGRLIEADRILIEAGEALARAKADEETSIIAFKSDPEKYRNFIRNRV